MADNQLSATTGSGTQTTTQSPQTAGQPAATGTQSSGIQPGTATSLLSSGQNGVTLHDTPLSTVNLVTPAPALPLATSTAQPAQQPAKHHINPVLFGLPILLFVIAAVFFWATSRTVKSTT